MLCTNADVSFLRQYFLHPIFCLKNNHSANFAGELYLMGLINLKTVPGTYFQQRTQPAIQRYRISI